MAPDAEPRPPRYPKHPPTVGPRMKLDGVDLGPAMLPQDILIWMRLCGMDDEEIIPAFQAGADRLERVVEDPASPDRVMAELTVEDRAEAVRQAREVTPSRVLAWRRRHRQMTWLELRALYVGLRENGETS